MGVMNTNNVSTTPILLLVCCLVFLQSIVSLRVVKADLNYKDALTKSLIFLEAQRSGKLPPNHRPAWRGDSALDDGQLANVDLVGGYYDAGDNVKYGLPMAFTITTLAWGALAYPEEIEAAGEMENVKAALQWGTDYFLKAASRRNRLYVQLYQLAKNHKGTYDGECPFYCSYSGFNDELLWAATWLYIATKRPVYLKYIQEESISASVAEFSWDLKYAGAQILLSKFFFEGEKGLQMYKNQADSYICSNLPDSPFHQIYVSPGGMVHLRDGANTQYVAGTAFLFSAYSDLLATYKQTAQCADKSFDSTQLMMFAKKQMDYILGTNPQGRSYMVGFGNNPPKQAHHRGASVPVLAPNVVVNCPMSFVDWFNKDTPNPNELTGAILGGPDRTDNFNDKRSDSPMTEPVIYTNSLAVGVLAKLAVHKF